jgi:hypothetical protein
MGNLKVKWGEPTNFLFASSFVDFDTYFGTPHSLENSLCFVRQCSLHFQLSRVLLELDTTCFQHMLLIHFSLVNKPRSDTGFHKQCSLVCCFLGCTCLY